jgi:hypothetical protein
MLLRAFATGTTALQQTFPPDFADFLRFFARLVNKKRAHSGVAISEVGDRRAQSLYCAAAMTYGAMRVRLSRPAPATRAPALSYAPSRA